MTLAEFVDRLVRLGGELFAPDESATAARRYFVEGFAELGRTIVAGRRAALDRFEQDFMLDPLRFRYELLGRTALRKQDLKASKALQLDVLGAHPDLLAPLHRLRRETSHTRVLAWALGKHHFMEARPLERFLERVGSRLDELELFDTPPWSAADVTSAIVTAERHLPGYGRVDLSIELPSALVLVEVKVDAQQRPQQLTDYKHAAEELATSSKKAPVVALLTADPEEEPAILCPHLTFQQLLRDWLAIAAEGHSTEHAYLAAYLSSVARIVEVGDSGRFDDWDFAVRGRALSFIENEDV